MGLHNPLGLWWLALAGPILLLYLLRLRRRELRVPSVLLWERAAADLQADTPFQRLRGHLLLYLQLAILLLGVLATARPFVRTSQLGGPAVVAILDVSASMSAREPGGTRFEQARRRLEAMVAELGRGEELMIVAASDRAEVLHPFSGDRRSLARALASARSTDRRTDLRDALFLAGSVARRRPETVCYLLSDGATADVGELAAGAASLRFVPVGRPVENLAITTFAARGDWSAEARRELLLTVECFGDRPREVQVELRADDRPFDVISLSPAPGRPAVEVLDDLRVGGGLLEARLLVEDALPADDRAFLWLGSRRDRGIWLLGESNLFLERALALLPEARLIKASLATAQQAAAERRLPAGVVFVILGESPTVELPAPTLWINATGPGAPATSGGELELPAIADWNRQHPLMLDVDLTDVAIARAARLTPRPWAAVLAETRETPLIVAGERAAGRQVLLGFDLLDSDLPLRPAFPILIANALAWLTQGARTELSPAVAVGDPIDLDLPTTARVAEVRGPDGTVRVDLDDGRLRFADTDRAGLYQVTAGEAVGRFAVSLTSASESDLTPRREVRVGAARISAPPTERIRERELWPPLVYLALAVLLLEWWWFHRRG